jgi:hypothetical protein
MSASPPSLGAAASLAFAPSSAIEASATMLVAINTTVFMMLLLFFKNRISFQEIPIMFLRCDKINHCVFADDKGNVSFVFKNSDVIRRISWIRQISLITWNRLVRNGPLLRSEAE